MRRESVDRSQLPVLHSLSSFSGDKEGGNRRMALSLQSCDSRVQERLEDLGYEPELRKCLRYSFRRSC